MPSDMPNIDDHLVNAETTRAELVRGQLLEAMPAHPPHGDMHVRIAQVIESSLAPGYVASADLLTRYGPQSDFATDLCVRREGVDSATGSRFLEEVCFEVLYTQSMADITASPTAPKFVGGCFCCPGRREQGAMRALGGPQQPKSNAALGVLAAKTLDEFWSSRTKAQDVIARGVRRMFAIRVKGIGSGHDAQLDESATALLEWSANDDQWLILSRDEAIDDACFIRPVSVRALLDATAKDDAVVHALRAKGNRVIQEIRDEGFVDGRAEGLRDGRAEGLRDGREEGLRDGLRDGRAEGARQQLLQLIEDRLARLGVTLMPAQHALLMGCDDLPTLQQWLNQLIDGDIPEQLSLD